MNERERERERESEREREREREKQTLKVLKLVVDKSFMRIISAVSLLT